MSNNIKKILLDLAKEIQYQDCYDLTSAPKVLKNAANKIGDLEMEIIDLKHQLQNETSKEITPKKTKERSKIKEQLEQYGIPYSIKDNTQRLFRKLQRYLQENYTC